MVCMNDGAILHSFERKPIEPFQKYFDIKYICKIIAGRLTPTVFALDNIHRRSPVVRKIRFYVIVLFYQQRFYAEVFFFSSLFPSSALFFFLFIDWCGHLWAGLDIGFAFAFLFCDKRRMEKWKSSGETALMVEQIRNGNRFRAFRGGVSKSEEKPCSILVDCCKLLWRVVLSQTSKISNLSTFNVLCVAFNHAWM